MSELRDRAVEKLEKELGSISDKMKKQFAEPCIEYLKKRCDEEDSICEDILQEHKTWEKCYKYVCDQAAKALNRTNGPVWHETVFEWVEDYFHLDDKALEEKRAKEDAERKKRQAAAVQKAKEKKETKKRNGSAGGAKAGSADQPKEKPVPKEKPEPKKKSNEVEGQMDLFSLL